MRAVCRSASRLPASTKGHAKLAVVEASVLDMTDDEMMGEVRQCDVVVSCLGACIV